MILLRSSEMPIDTFNAFIDFLRLYPAGIPAFSVAPDDYSANLQLQEFLSIFEEEDVQEEEAMLDIEEFYSFIPAGDSNEKRGQGNNTAEKDDTASMMEPVKQEEKEEEDEVEDSEMIGFNPFLFEDFIGLMNNVVCSEYRETYNVGDQIPLVVISGVPYRYEIWAYGSTAPAAANFMLHTDLWESYERPVGFVPLAFELAATYLRNMLKDPERKLEVY
jgi:hypothetical protein